MLLVTPSFFFILLTFSVGADLGFEDCERFLKHYMQKTDLETLTNDYLASHISEALRVRQVVPWGRQIPDIMFLNDVLPFASLTEPREFWRSWWSDQMLDLVTCMGPISACEPCQDVECAVNRLNDVAWGNITFVASPPNMINSYSIFQTLERGNSSCSGLAIYLTAALRSVGVPARVTGVPHWSGCQSDADPKCGNHNWVEAFIPGKGWSYIDQQRRGETGHSVPLNQSWFDDLVRRMDGTENHTVYATSFADPIDLKMYSDYFIGEGVKEGGRFPLAWDWADRSINAWNVTGSYV